MTPPDSLQHRVYCALPGPILARSLVSAEFTNVGSTRAADHGLAQVTDVEQADILTDRSVFGDDAGVRHRHLPATERRERRAEFDMDGVDGPLQEFFVGHGPQPIGLRCDRSRRWRTSIERAITRHPLRLDESPHVETHVSTRAARSLGPDLVRSPEIGKRRRRTGRRSHLGPTTVPKSHFGDGIVDEAVLARAARQPASPSAPRAEAEELTRVPAPAELPVASVLAVGLGAADKYRRRTDPSFGRRRSARADRCHHRRDHPVVLDLAAAAEGFALGSYTFTEFRSAKSAPKDPTRAPRPASNCSFRPCATKAAKADSGPFDRNRRGGRDCPRIRQHPAQPPLPRRVRGAREGTGSRLPG